MSHWENHTAVTPCWRPWLFLSSPQREKLGWFVDSFLILRWPCEYLGTSLPSGSAVLFPWYRPGVKLVIRYLHLLSIMQEQCSSHSCFADTVRLAWRPFWRAFQEKKILHRSEGSAVRCLFQCRRVRPARTGHLGQFWHSHLSISWRWMFCKPTHNESMLLANAATADRPVWPELLPETGWCFNQYQLTDNK